MTSFLIVRWVMTLSSPPRSNDLDVEDPGETTRKSTEGRPGRWRASREMQIAAALPFVVAALLYMVPGFYDRLFVKPPDILGVPFGFVLQLLSLAWAALGAAVIAQTRFRFMALLALTVCTIPAVIGAVFVVRLTEIMQNLG